MRQRVRAAPLLLEGPSHWGECSNEKPSVENIKFKICVCVGPRTVAHDCRYGKSFGDDKHNRPCSSNTILTNFSTYLDKKYESKRKND